MTLRARFAMVRNQMPIVMERAMAQKDWYLFFTNIYQAVTEGLPQPEEAATITASPMVYTAVIRGQVLIEGGTVSVIEFSRNGRDWYDTGMTAGFVQMDRADQLRVTYAVAPNIVYFPM
jgi:hypothetical protein